MGVRLSLPVLGPIRPAIPPLLRARFEGNEVALRVAVVIALAADAQPGERGRAAATLERVLEPVRPPGGKHAEPVEQRLWVDPPLVLGAGLRRRNATRERKHQRHYRQVQPTTPATPVSCTLLHRTLSPQGRA
jgi:hypothetical protein